MKWINTALLDAAWPAFCSWSLCHLASEKRRALAQKGTGMSKKGLRKGTGRRRGLSAVVMTWRHGGGLSTSGFELPTKKITRRSLFVEFVLSN